MEKKNMTEYDLAECASCYYAGIRGDCLWSRAGGGWICPVCGSSEVEIRENHYEDFPDDVPIPYTLPRELSAVLGSMFDRKA